MTNKGILKNRQDATVIEKKSVGPERSFCICLSFLPEFTLTNIIKHVKKVDEFEEYQSKCKSILQKMQEKKLRQREMLYRGEERDMGHSQKRKFSTIKSSRKGGYDDKFVQKKQRLDSQERYVSKQSYNDQDHGKNTSKNTKHASKRRYEIQKYMGYQDKFSEPDLEDYDDQALLLNDDDRLYTESHGRGK